jgi:ribosomal protein S18 acetylase RimI-like enzyme
MSLQAATQALEIRDLGLHDIAAFAVLRHRIAEQNRFALPALDRLPADREEFAARVAQALTDPAQKRILAWRGGRLVGFVSANREGGAAQLAIGIEAAHIGQGVGRQLMDAVERWARAAKLARLQLEVMAHNRRAIALYEHCGFHLDNRVNGKGNAGDICRMSKILD